MGTETKCSFKLDGICVFQEAKDMASPDGRAKIVKGRCPATGRSASWSLPKIFILLILKHRTLARVMKILQPRLAGEDKQGHHSKQEDTPGVSPRELHREKLTYLPSSIEAR